MNQFPNKSLFTWNQTKHTELLSNCLIHFCCLRKNHFENEKYATKVLYIIFSLQLFYTKNQSLTMIFYFSKDVIKFRVKSRANDEWIETKDDCNNISYNYF